MPYRYRFRPRYIDCDAQRVMHNANYLAYLDDAVDCFVRDALGEFEEGGFDFMLKKVVVEWQGPARHNDWVDIDVSVSRLGNTSFDIVCVAKIDGNPCFTAVCTNVSTTPGAPVPAPIPDVVRVALAE